MKMPIRPEFAFHVFPCDPNGEGCSICFRNDVDWEKDKKQVPGYLEDLIIYHTATGNRALAREIEEIALPKWRKHAK